MPFIFVLPGYIQLFSDKKISSKSKRAIGLAKIPPLIEYEHVLKALQHSATSS